MEEEHSIMENSWIPYTCYRQYILGNSIFLVPGNIMVFLAEIRKATCCVKMRFYALWCSPEISLTKTLLGWLSVAKVTTVGLHISLNTWTWLDKWWKSFGPGGALTWKGSTGMSGSQDPLFTPLLPPFRSPVAAWFSSLDPTLSEKLEILTHTREIFQKFKEFSALQPKFGSNFSSLALKMLKIFSSLDLTFAKKNQFFRPPFRRSAPDIPTQTKVECPPRVKTTHHIQGLCFSFNILERE